MTLKLNAVQRRVLGVLIEKARTTPAGYPLTLNALVVGSNQVSCREPVMRVSEDEVAKAARQLGERRLATEVDPERGARVERYRHTVEETMRWNEAQQAVMAELLLRGPQTAGELKTNASRMAPLPELDAVIKLLRDFAAQDPPLVRELPRQPGKSASRYDHLLYSEDEARVQTDPAPPSSTSVSPTSLESRLEKLEGEVAALRQELQALRQKQM